jgi:MFS family permease
VRRRAAVPAGLLTAGLAGVLLAYVNVLPVSLVAAFLVSLFGTSALVRVWALLADVHGSRRTVAMTEGEVVVSASGILTAVLVGGLTASPLGWRFAFVVGAGVAAVGALAVALVDVPDQEPTPPEARRRTVRLAPTLVVVFAVVGLEFALSFWLASFLHDDLGLPRSAAAAMVGGLYAANLVGRLAASRLARRVDALPLLVAALLLALGGAPVLLVAGSAWAAGPGVALLGAGTGAMFPLVSSLHLSASSRGSDGAMGAVLSVAAMGQILGPLGVGVVAQWSSLRAGLLMLPGLVAVALAGIAVHRATTSGRAAAPPVSSSRRDSSPPRPRR